MYIHTCNFTKIPTVLSMHVCMLIHISHVSLFVTPWPVTCQALLPMGFTRKEYWSELPFPSPGDLLDPGVEFRSSILQADFFFLPTEPPGKPKESSIYTGEKTVSPTNVCKNAQPHLKNKIKPLFCTTHKTQLKMD